jgi:hypothetical protein
MGDNSERTIDIVRWNGSIWSTSQVGTQYGSMYGPWGASPDDLWLVGDQGTMLRRRQ